LPGYFTKSLGKLGWGAAIVCLSLYLARTGYPALAATHAIVAQHDAELDKMELIQRGGDIVPARPQPAPSRAMPPIHRRPFHHHAPGVAFAASR
jgi:hypothetical protein